MARSAAALLALLIFVSSRPAGAQSVPPPPEPPDAQQVDDDRPVQLSVTLVQVDAVVVDKDGRQVTDLTAADFEILEDGRPQAITDFSYVAGTPAAAAPAPAAPAAPRPGAPAARLRPEQVRRTIAIVVDALAFEDIHFARRAMKKFVEEQMQPGDLVAIVQARAGARSFQTFTSDKRQLLAAIERVRWSPSFLTSDAPLDRDPDADCGEDVRSSPVGRGTAPGAGGGATGTPIAFNEGAAFRAETFTRGTLGVLQTVARGLQELPGRKAVILLSSGFPIDLGKCGYRVEKALQGLIDTANRASVGIYSVDVRGLQVLGPTAADSISDPRQIGELISRRQRNFFHSQDILSLLAKQSGGTFTRNSNDITGAIRRAADDQNGYYLIAYQPEEATFAGREGKREFHKLSVKVKRPGLTVRSRTGFYGITDDELRVTPQTPGEQLVRAILSPFGAEGVRLEAVPVYVDDAAAGATVRCLVHFDARDLTYTETPTGSRKTNVDVVVLLLNEYGVVVDRQVLSHELEMSRAVYEAAVRDGIDYAATFPVKRAGGYQVRVAVRDAASQRIGSAFETVDVPDLKKGRLALSDVMIGGATGVTATATTVRRFRRGETMIYGFEVYNARREGAARPRLEIATKLYRDGAPVFTSASQPFDVGDQPDWARIRAGRALQLGTEMAPGAYVLEVTVTDAGSKKKPNAVTRWIEFDVE